jgi:hypothetical protein
VFTLLAHIFQHPVLCVLQVFKEERAVLYAQLASKLIADPTVTLKDLNFRMIGGDVGPESAPRPAVDPATGAGVVRHMLDEIWNEFTHEVG